VRPVLVRNPWTI